MADWNFPTIASLYTDLISLFKQRDDDCAKMFDGTGSNIPVGTIRWNSGLSRFEKLQADLITWSPLASKYEIDVAKLNGLTNNSTNVPNSIVQRNASGDATVRAIRQEFDTLNTNINYVLTQVTLGAGNDNYLRPSTPAQFRASVTDSAYLGVNAKAADSELLDGLDSTQFVRSDVNNSIVGNHVTTGAISHTSGAAIRVLQPKGGLLDTPDLSNVGYLKITLPVSWTNTMMSFDVGIFDYAGDVDGESIKINLTGYNHVATSSWANVQATVTSGRMDKFYNVRFGHDGTKCAIYIGEAATIWNYPVVSVSNFVGGHLGATEVNWADGWVLGFTATLGTITKTKALENVASSVSVNGVGALQYIPITEPIMIANNVVLQSNVMQVIDVSQFMGAKYVSVLYQMRDNNNPQAYTCLLTLQTLENRTVPINQGEITSRIHTEFFTGGSEFDNQSNVQVMLPVATDNNIYFTSNYSYRNLGNNYHITTGNYYLLVTGYYA